LRLVVIVLVLFPLVYVAGNPMIALAALAAAIVYVVVDRTRPPQRPKRRPAEPEYPRGYEH
jgi:hypothetical protein